MNLVFFFFQVLLEIAFSASLCLYSDVALKVTVAMTARMYRRDHPRAISKARVYRGMFGARRAELLASLYGLMGSAGVLNSIAPGMMTGQDWLCL
jgi:hypothetical protein